MIVFLLIINLISFIIYGFDKLFAIFKVRRIPEVTLYFLSISGGGLGSLLAMILFRHKIRKHKFWIINILCLFLWTILCFCIII